MSSFNRVILIGNVTRDVDLRFTPSGTPVTDIGLAVNDIRGKDKKEETIFVDVTIWGRIAEVANQYLIKGSRILVEGRLRQDKWTDKDGNNRSKIKVVCENMRMLDGRNNQNSNQPASEDGGVSEIDVDEVPF